MRQIILTGLGEETDLQTGETKYMLVFNRGALRLPATEEIVKQIISIAANDEAGMPAQVVPGSAPQEWQAPRPQIQFDRSNLPADHGAAQVPFHHELPPGTPKPKPRQGDYASPPTGPMSHTGPMADDEPEDEDGRQF